MFFRLKIWVSEDDHRVAVAVKAVFSINGFGVKFLEPVDSFFASRGEEGGHETEQSRLWQMEVSNHAVDGGKFVGWVDVDVGLSLHGA